MGTNALLLEQLTWHWEHQARPPLDGLTDDELFWEPVDGCWSIRPREASTAPVQGGSGRLVAEFAFPEPDAAPVTTIAWRLGHLVVGCFGMRNAAHFGGPPMDYLTHEWPETAKEMVAALDDGYERWVEGVRSLGEEGLWRPVGDAEPFPDAPYAALVLHINREVIHHLAEVSLLRDLYRCR